MYDKQPWRNGENGGTVVDAAHLAYMEQGISDAHDLADPLVVAKIARDTVGASLEAIGWDYNPTTGALVAPPALTPEVAAGSITEDRLATDVTDLLASIQDRLAALEAAAAPPPA